MAQRLIDADALYMKLVKMKDFGELTAKKAIRAVENAPTIDAVPSDMFKLTRMLCDFIREIGAITYGKERFFYEDVGCWRDLWYDRKSCEWITTKTAIEECLKAVRELDDGVLDAELVKHATWEMKPDPYGFFDEIPVCSECGCTTKMRDKPAYCPHCGARMDVND